jgi:outer membrane protein assembly factor BamB
LYTGGYVINTEDDSVSSIVNRGSHAVVHDEQLFVSGSAEDGKLGRVSAFALGSLSSSWDKTLEPVDDDRSFPMGSPTFAHETIYQATGDGTLHAINSATGDTRWRYDLGGQKAQTPAVQDDVIYVSGERETVALSRTGDTNWTRSDAFSSSPVVKDHNLFFFGRDNDRAVYSLDVNDGSIRWSKDIGSSNWAPGIRNLAVDADSVYVNTDATIQRFSRSDGVEEWQTQFEGAGELCTSENQVYAVGRDNSGGGITAVAKDTGAEVWTEIVDSPIMTEPIISGANLYFGTGDGTYLITGMTDG